jgi:two-component system, NarL family, sensor histidine kinase DesK
MALAGGGLFIYTSSGAAGWLPTRKAAATIVALVVFVGGVVAWTQNFSSALSAITFVGIVGAIVVAFGWSAANSQQLRLTREEMARVAAVNEERLRIARDLHDLLGHNLSLIALKSELARRLVNIAPERAVNELSDIDGVARQALKEVREAVASYRQPTLASELQGAREMLAAGINYRYEGNAGVTVGLASAIASALGWVVREGVTNVIRHSGASQCLVRVARDDQSIHVEMIDDGKMSSAGGDEIVGNGLRGLAERVTALGGTFEARRHESGGFCLLAIVPIASNVQTPAAIPLHAQNADRAQNTIAANQP